MSAGRSTCGYDWAFGSQRYLELKHSVPCPVRSLNWMDNLPPSMDEALRVMQGYEPRRGHVIGRLWEQGSGAD